MFGITRRKATNAAVEATLPIVKTLEISRPLPNKFWEDPFVLGFIYITIASFAKISTGGKVTGADLGQCMFDTFSRISGRDGVEIGERATNFANHKNREFFLGMEKANKVIDVGFGSREFDHDKDVIEAISRVDALGSTLDFLGETSRVSKITAQLMIVCFYNVVRERFGYEGKV